MFFSNFNGQMERNKAVLERYPFLWPVDESGRELPVEVFGYGTTQLDGIPSGWMSAFGVQMLDGIAEAIKGEGLGSGYHLNIRVGSGRISLHGSVKNGRVQLVLDSFEWRSERTCSSCGATAAYRVKVNGLPLCVDCKSAMEHGRNLSHGDFEHIVEFPTWLDFRDGRWMEFDGDAWHESAWQTLS